MACGTLHLTRYFSGLEEHFQNGKHLVWFESIDEAVDLAKRYLREDEARERIAAAGREEVVAKHCWDVRVAELLDRAQIARSPRRQGREN